MQPKYTRDIFQVNGLSFEEKIRLKNVTEMYGFYANDYYLNLINWDDPDDPIRKIVIPQGGEVLEGGSFDPSNEKSFTVSKGLEHKYGPTALFLASRACGGVCRFCFRKRIFQPDNQDAIPELSAALDYLRKHEEINNVLISGGDPLVLPTRVLEHLLEELQKIEHIRFIRIGTKMVVYNPFRILEDPTLSDMVRRFSKQDKKLYFITDINHPRELTRYSIAAINMLQHSGGIVSNQTPLLKGINNDKETLMELFNKLSSIGVPPYYVFQCRPTVGNRPFIVPLEEGYRIFERAKAEVSGLAKRSRYIISHSTGKLEVTALTDEHIIFKYHNAAHEENDSRVLIYKRNPYATWLDDYTELVGSYGPDVQYSGKFKNRGETSEIESYT
jgi:KamA family protein